MQIRISAYFSNVTAIALGMTLAACTSGSDSSAPAVSAPDVSAQPATAELGPSIPYQPKASQTADAEIPFADGAWQWSAGTYEDAKIVEELSVDTGMRARSKHDLPVDHPVTKRLQHWADRLHVRLLETQPPGFKVIPRPIVRVYVGRGNADVRPKIKCTDMPVQVGKWDGKAINRREVVTMVPSSHSKIGMQIGVLPIKCEESVRDGETLSQVLGRARAASTNYDMRPSSQCHLQSIDSALNFSNHCGAFQSQNFAASKLAFMTTLNVVSVGVGLIYGAQDEAEVVGVLYHELGHYYGAHVTTGRADQITLFYDQSTYSGLGRPSADPRYAQLARSAMTVGDAMAMHSVPDQIYHSAVSLMMDALKTTSGKPNELEKLCRGRDDCMKTCSEYHEMFNGISFTSIVWDDPGQAFYGLRKLWNKLSFHNYRRGEYLFRGCAEKINYSDRGASTGLPDELIIKLSGKTDDGKPLTLAHAAEALSKMAAAGEDVMRKAKEVKMGFYTAEQEADMMAVRFSALVGVNPRKVADWHLRSLKGLDEVGEFGRSVDYVTYPQCLKYRAQNWIEGGKRVVLPVGGFVNPHHSECFRVRNIDLAIEALGSPIQETTELMSLRDWRAFKIKMGIVEAAESNRLHDEY